jgi:hypothetical protein
MLKRDELIRRLTFIALGLSFWNCQLEEKLMMVDENTSLVQWAWRQIQDSKTIVDVLDEEVIRKPCNLDEMCFVFKLGILCTCTNPSKRPSMKEGFEESAPSKPSPKSWLFRSK